MDHTEEINMLLEIAKEAMEHSIDHLQNELIKVRTGKASSAMLSGLMVSYYGSPTPLNQVANVASSDARTLIIQPWEKGMIQPIEKAIFEANLGVTPQNDGEVIRISIPPLTEERRKDLVKTAKALAEDAKVGVRGARHKGMDGVKAAVKNGYPEDLGHDKEVFIQNMTNDFGKKIDALVVAKEKDIMTI